jgi:hypothetical protein
MIKSLTIELEKLSKKAQKKLRDALKDVYANEIEVTATTVILRWNDAFDGPMEANDTAAQVIHEVFMAIYEVYE